MCLCFWYVQQRHGAPQDLMRHIGDLGNIKAADVGLVKVEFLNPIISLQGGPWGIVGRTLIVHMAQDDFGHGHDEESIKTGNAVASICCVIIGYLNWSSRVNSSLKARNTATGFILNVGDLCCWNVLINDAMATTFYL